MSDKVFKFSLSQTAFYILSQTACNRTKPVCDYRAHCGNVKDFFHYLYNFFVQFGWCLFSWDLADLTGNCSIYPATTKFRDCAGRRGNQSAEEGELCAQSIAPARTDKQHERHPPLPQKMHRQNVHSRDGNVITAQVSKLLMGLRNIYWCTGNDVWQFDLAKGLFCMPNAAPCSVLSFWFTLQCFNVKASADMGSYCRDVCRTG